MAAWNLNHRILDPKLILEKSKSRNSGMIAFYMTMAKREVVFSGSVVTIFWPRATLKGPKRSFVVVVVLLLLPLDVETWVKDVPNRAKIRKGNKKCTYVNIMVLNCRVCHVWPYVALYALMWPCMAFFVFVWPFYGLKWHFMVFYGRISSFLVVRDPNSFGLVMIRLVVQWLLFWKLFICRNRHLDIGKFRGIPIKYLENIGDQLYWILVKLQFRMIQTILSNFTNFFFIYFISEICSYFWKNFKESF